MATLTGTQNFTQSRRSAPGTGTSSQVAPREVMGMNVDHVIRGLGWFSIGLGLTELLAPRFVARLVGGRNHKTLIRSYGLREIGAGVGLLSTRRPTGWLWARVAGDMVDLASLGGVLASPRGEAGKAIFNIAAVAGVTALDILTAQELTSESAEAPGKYGAHAETSLIVGRSPEDCYNFWANFENLPRFMNYLQSVRITGDRMSHWVARAPGDVRLEWDSESTFDEEGKRITWHSMPGSDVHHAGSVDLQCAPGGRGTIVRMQVDYGNSLHKWGAAAAKLIGKDPEQILNKELRRYRAVMETGEALTTEGQPAGRRSGATWLDSIAR